MLFIGSVKGTTLLVTGGAGAIGSNLILALSELVGSGGKVIILDNLSSIREKNPWNVVPLDNIMFIEGDVRSDIDLKRVCSFHRRVSKNAERDVFELTAEYFSFAGIPIPLL